MTVPRERMTMKEWREYQNAMQANGSCDACTVRDECFALRNLREAAAFVDRRFTEMALAPKTAA